MSTGWIDVHHHLLPEPYVEALIAEGISDVAGRDRPEWSPELSLGVMDRNGIETAVLSLSATGVHFGDDAKARALARTCNEYAAEQVSRHAGRFGYFASLPLPDLEGSLEELSFVFDTLHVDGIVMQSSNFDGSYVGDPRFDDLLAELNRRKSTVFIHPAIPSFIDSIQVKIPVFAMEFTFDTTRAAFNLVYNGAIERFPDITWIFSHAGGTVPFLAGRFSLLWMTEPALVERAPKGAVEYLKSFYFDTALSTNEHALGSLFELVGFDHVLFGSDYPFAPELATTLSVAAIDTDDRFDHAGRELVRRHNALRLLPGVAARLR